MIEDFADSFIKKLILLEERTGAHVSYAIMPPPLKHFYDHLSIQAVAKEIASFIGLEGYRFIIAFTKQVENTAARIDLENDGSEVFIEISNDIVNSPETVSVVLSHEICHKWLMVHGIRSALERDNEILTDITAIFLGLGKIMLNGCHTSITLDFPTLDGGIHTKTQEMNTGYLRRDQLAFVYRLVCAMRKIPESELLAGLNAASIEAIVSCDDSYACYDSKYHSLEAIQESAGQFMKVIVELQNELADLEKNLNYVRRSCCEEVDNFINKGHKEIGLLQDRVSEIKQHSNIDPALRFLKAIKAEYEFGRMQCNVSTLIRNTNVWRRRMRVIGRHLHRNSNVFPKPDPSMFNVIACRRDGTKLRLPESSGDILVTCPTCKYQFAYNTNVPEFFESPAPSNGKQGFWERIHHLCENGIITWFKGIAQRIRNT